MANREQASDSERRGGKVAANGIEICYEDWGDPQHPPVVLIMGLGTQLVGWPEDLCRALVDGGRRVIRFDNRDIGHSQKLENSRNSTSVRMAYVRTRLGLPVRAPYTLFDMAADVVGLLDALEIDRAHLVGASMGGMIAQILSARHSERVSSLTSIMSSSGARWLPQGRLKALMRLGMAPPSRERDAMLDHFATTLKIIGSPGFPMSHEQRRARAAIGLDRCYYPAGTARQMLAVFASGPRTHLLREIKVPSLVIHGSKDPLVPLTHGRHTARSIPGARLEVIRGMGHDLPPQLFGRLTQLILDHTRQG